MKKYFIILLCCVFSTTLHAQSDIVAMEYFIDTDPGVGSATPVSVTSGATIDIDVSVPTTSLSEGFHTIHFRTQNADGLWSFYESRTFLVQNIDPLITPPPADIVAMEYFIDDDPGQGSAQSVSVTSGQIVDLTMLVSSASLSNGFHTISYRTQNDDGHWGFYETRVFYIQPPEDPSLADPIITEMEYFFDDDPGQGNATSITGLTSGAVVDIERLIPNSLSAGWHTFNVRARDDNGNWGFTETRVVYVEAGGSVTTIPSLIDKFEYFFGDNDPGLGNATEIEVDPNTDNVDIASLLVPTEETIPVGMNTITFRAQNEEGLFGFSETREFEVIDDCDQPVADFSVNLACAGETIEFIDNSTNVQGDAEYRWYLDGDDIVDDMTTGNVSFAYVNPGIYQVALAISQGQICYDSMFMDIEVKAKPIVVFNADRVEVGSPTNYIVDQFNVDGTFSWDWDFETDAIIDDNTAGNTSFTFPAASSYLTTLNVSDGLGCGTTFSRSVTVDPITSGGGPSAIFQPTTVCLGAPTTFTDLSTNIPPGSSYSWDFDSDGSEDDTTIGSTQFVYAAPGDYTAVLTIDTGTEIINAMRLVSVIANPVAEFAVNDVCLGDEASFTDLSSATGSTIYSWDFDGDGIEDSNTSGDQTFTFSAPGTYSVLLRLDNGNGCIDTQIETVNVISVPSAGFSFVVACAGESSTFINESSGFSALTEFQWDFNNDDIIDSNLSNPSFTFPTAGTYEVSLVVDNGSGCINEISQSIIINDQPAVNFEPIINCNSLLVDFIDGSTEVAPSATYSWDFDNDGVSDSNNIGNTAFTYPSSGVYLASLTIENGIGCSLTEFKTVIISDLIAASFEVQSACVGEEITFINTSENVSTGASYEWDFDNDGIIDSNDLNPTNTFSLGGTYPIFLTVNNVDGCSDSFTLDVVVQDNPQVDFDIALSCQDDPVVFTNQSTGVDTNALVEWDFTNDGIVDSNEPENVSFNYSGPGPFSVSLNILNETGCSAQIIKTVQFENVPIADFAVSNTCIGETTVFTDETINTSSGATYSWDFDGDGIEDSNVPGSVSFTYPASGIYTIELTVSNNGCDDTIVKEVEIFDTPIIDLPSEIDLCEGSTVTLDLGPGFLSYEWIDGTTNQSLTVDAEGTYSVLVTDENGCQSLAEVMVVGSLLPVADFDIIYSIEDESISIITENLSENADSFTWDFGDGNTSSELNPIHTYADVNILFGAQYELCLTASNSCESTVYCEIVNLTITDQQNDISNAVEIYPNPSEGELQVLIPDNWLEKNPKILVYTITGSLIKEELISSTETEMIGLNQGAYFIQVKSDDHSVVQKIIVK